MKKIAVFATKHPWLVIGVLIVLTVFFGFFARQVTMTTDIKEFFPESDPRVKTYQRVEELFGGAEYIMVALQTGDVFQKESLEAINRLTIELQEIDGVASVRSLTSIEDIKGTEFGLEISELISEIPESQSDLGQLEKKILNDSLYSGFIVSKDASTALNVIEVNTEADSVEVASEVSRIVNNYQGPGKVYLTGTPVLNNVLAESMQADLKKLLPLVLGIIALILFLVFKDLKGVILPFTTVLLSVIWTLGIMGLLDKSISPLNAVMPIILISLGNAYGIYLLNRYREELKLGLEPLPAVQAAVSSVGIAILMAGGTTIAGFASNVFSDITLMVDFGLFTSFGVAAALLVSLTLIPAALTLIKPKKIDRHQQDKGLLRNITEWSANLGVNHSWLIIGLVILIIFVSILGLPRLKTDSNFFNFFAHNSPPRIAYDLVKEKFTGSESVEVIIEGDIQDPAVLQAMKKFQNKLEETGLVGQVTSLVNIIERTNQAMHEGDQAFHKIPDDPALISQYLLLIEMSDSSYLQKFTTLDYSKARIQALVRDTSSRGTESLMKNIQEYSARYFEPLKITTTSTGIIVLIDALADMIIEGQIKGLIFALVSVLLIVLILLRSWQGSIISVFLIALVILINFGVMGWAGIPLDIVTVLISSIGVGVGIDYSIHIYSRYLEEKKKGKGYSTAMTDSVKTTGKSIISNAGAVISGFIILVFSSFPPFRYFGILVSLIMFAAAAGAMLWIPAVVTVSHKINNRFRKDDKND